MRCRGLLLLALLAGCLEREETVTVHRDGRVDVAHRIKGQKDDVQGGAARLPAAAPWTVERAVEVDDEGEEQHILTARASFASAEDVPGDFAPPGDPFAAQALRFATEVQVRREGNRTHYRFVRTYEPRTWGPYAMFERRSFPEELKKKIEGADDPASLPAADQRRLLMAFVAYERMKMQHWAESALEAVAPEHAGFLDARLAVRRAIADYCDEELNPGALEGILERPDDEVAALARRVHDDVAALTVAVARGALGLDEAQGARVAHAFRAAHHDYEVTQDLKDENFVVRLRLPGRLVADNGDRHEDGVVVWRFSGEDLRDRREVLIATSVVE